MASTLVSAASARRRRASSQSGKNAPSRSLGTTLTAGPSIDPEQFLHEQLLQASPDLMRGMGGTVESFYFAFGDADVYVVDDLPDDESAAAVAFTVSAAGVHDEHRQAAHG